MSPVLPASMRCHLTLSPWWKCFGCFFRKITTDGIKKPPKICSSGDDIAAFQKAQPNPAPVWASTSQGDEIILDNALISAWPVDLLIVSLLFRGSNPYPCGSLTYRVLLFRPYHMLSSSFCQPFCCKSDFIFIIFLLFHQNRRNVIILLVVASYNKSFISPPACLLEVLGQKDQDGNQY